MFKPYSWQGHNEYRTMVTKIGRRLSRNNAKYSFDIYEDERQKPYRDPLAGFIQAFFSTGGRPAKHQAQILRHLILFVLLFNKTKARPSLTLWVREALPKSIALTVLVGCTCAEGLPPLGPYYDFMNRLWHAPRDAYARMALPPAGKNGKKPKKSSALTASSRNRKIPALSPPGISSMASWAANPLLIIRKASCRKFFSSLLSFRPSGLD